MRSEVYSWRLSTEKKQALEEVARKEGTTVSELLDRATDAVLLARDSGGVEEQRQMELHEALRSGIGVLSGGLGGDAKRVREVMRRKKSVDRAR